MQQRKIIKKPARKRSRVTPKTLLTEERSQTALAMRRDGATYVEIAKKLGVSKQAAWKMIQTRFDEIRSLTAESAFDVRDMMLVRLDQMLWALRTKIKRGDPRAIDTGLRIEDRRARLLGLDAPSRSEVSGPDGGAIEIDDAREQLIAAIEKLVPPDDSLADSGCDCETSD